ncbi:MAG: energy transducer TonB [Myxococcota bacterium]
MRAVSQQSGPKILRIGVVQSGKVVDERLVKDRTHVTIGPSEKAMFVVPTRKVPPNFKLFELVGNDYHLNFLDDMSGRVALRTGVSDLAELKAQAKPVQAGQLRFSRLPLSEDARGKVVVGETTFLFQFVVPPPVQPKPQLPVSVQKGFAGDIDWFTTIVASFSFLLHFFLVALVYSDWMDPVVDDEYALTRLVETAKNLPPPPELERPTADEEAEVKDAKEKTEEKKAEGPKKPAPKGDTGKAAPSKDPGKTAAEAADEKAADLAAQLAELDVQTMGALKTGGPAVEGVLDDGDVPSGMLDDAAQSSAAAGSGDPGGLKMGGKGSGSMRPGEGGDGKLSDLGKTGSGDGGTATDAGKTKEVKGPVGSASASGGVASGGAISNASSVIARMRSRFRRCYQTGLNSNPDLQGAVSLAVKVGPNGEVLSVGGGGGGLGSIMGCLKAVVRGAAFAPPEGGQTALVQISINFVKQ